MFSASLTEGLCLQILFLFMLVYITILTVEADTAEFSHTNLQPSFSCGFSCDAAQDDGGGSEGNGLLDEWPTHLCSRQLQCLLPGCSHIVFR